MLTYLILLILLIITFTLGLILTPYIVAISKELHLYDMPDSRKVHQLPIPRMGGMTFLPIVTIAISIVMVILFRTHYDVDTLCGGTMIQHFLSYMAGAMMLYTVGLYDDIHGVGYKAKFAVQTLSALMLCVSGLWVADFSYVFFVNVVHLWIGMQINVLFVVYVTNAMNLIDGIDGLASGLSCIALVVITLLNIIVCDIVWAMLSVSYLGVVMAFFYYNVFDKKSKTFMGDAGSLTLGFTLAFLVLHFWQVHPVWHPRFHNVGIVALSTLTIPMLDVVRVFASRIRDGRNPFLPDKNHIHHKLMRAGLSGRQTMVVILLLSLLFVLSNYLVAAYMSQTLIIVIDVLLYFLMHYVINIFITRREKASGVEYSRSFML